MPRRAGFTLMEMLAVMLIIITVLAMGVPAMYAAERKSWVATAMKGLIDLHQKAQRLQRQAAAQGLPDLYSIQVTNPGGGGSQPQAELLKGGAPLSPPVVVSISADDLVDNVKLRSGSNYTTTTFSWSYEPQTGYISDGLQDMRFAALGGRYSRVLKLYPLGFTEGN